MNNSYPGIAGKRILITGSSNGLGFAMAKALLANGAKVLVTGSTQASKDKAKAAFNLKDHELLTCVLDVRDVHSIQQALELMQGKWGGIDILINNAGIGMNTIDRQFLTKPLPFWQIHDEHAFKAIIDTNLTGYFLTAREVVPLFLQQADKGRIINIGISLAGMQRTGFAPYGASRAGSEALSRIMAQDLLGSGITVNILCPGGPTNTNQIPLDIPANMRAKLLSPDIMREATLFLCSDDAEGLHDARIDALDFDPKKYRV
jgi:NAD(P)-dependent dehydrogenase (short-subunit alcohol dehydrogenase family)